MRAVMFTDTRDIQVVDRPAPDTGDGQLLLQVDLCGICGTDLHAPQLDTLFTSPVVLGHEFTARVAGLGRNADGWAKGEGVVVNPIGLVCGGCRPCRLGFPNQCVVALSSDCVGVGKDGGMADLVALDAVHVHRLPEEVSVQAGTWTEPLAVAVRGVRRAGLTIGQSVAVLGAGPIGQLTLQVARAAGAGELLVVEPSAYRQEIARNCGADQAIGPDAVGDLDRLYDIVFDCTGAATALDTTVELVDHGGTIVVIGTYTGPPTLSTPFLPHAKEATITFSMCYRHESEFMTALGLLQRGQIDVAALTTRITGLDDHADAFAEMRDPERSVKILLAPAHTG